MTLKISTGLRDSMLGTGALKETMNAGFLRIYTGVQPSTADTGATGTLLCTLYSDGTTTGLHFADPATGTIAKANEVWSGTAVATGAAGWFRFSEAADVPTDSSTTAKRMDGAVAVSGSELNMSNTSIASGSIQTINTFSITLPA